MLFSQIIMAPYILNMIYNIYNQRKLNQDIT